MKMPLRYQMTEYDCGPSSLLNAVSFLFDREKIPPELVRNIMLYSLDTYNLEGQGREGTSRMAMQFLSSWLESYGKAGVFPISSSYLSGEQVYVGNNSPINSALRRGGVAVVRLYFEVEHYVLFTGDRNGEIRMFDPYFYDHEPGQTHLTVFDHPLEYNQIVPYEQFNRETTEMYALGEIARREAVLIFNSETMLSEEKSVEYFI